ncbi:hypothetical protein GZ77_07875 [Endozoicomonas montiporae]|uniref:Lipoprotein n=2 Tax=Endozoicomonas montiporae TaxID=1027273 RepID=A0A081N791_9GAMM|nr:hypothetical protein [Endozoicomonas montiporae]AMO55860.1 hypothetical protein EZMO1_1711 [Endozoicomonas montiporae CL-33]KEQ14314.1 hypothetical protein GZ77_07875 [Endozoicomonas montiporae]
MRFSQITRSLLVSATFLLFSQSLLAESQAYLHALATGKNNKQLIVRLPMDKPEDGSLPLVGRKGLSDLDHFGSNPAESLAGSHGYAWELAGEYEETCPVEYNFQLTQKPRVHEKTKMPLSVAESNSNLPKSQNLIVLDDGSLLFTCHRSRIILKHPNRHGAKKAYRYPELNLDITDFLTEGFDEKQEYNHEHGISLAYNKVNDIVYAGIEDRVFGLDLEALAKHPSFARIDSNVKEQTEDYLDAKYNYEQANLRTGKTLPYDARDFFIPLTSIINKSYSIIALSVVYRGENETPYLFASVATPDYVEAPTPLEMFMLGTDGRSIFLANEPSFNTGLQYGRFGYKNGEPDPGGKGIKGDLTFIAAETDVHYEPVLGMHTHHNNPVFVYHPYYTSEPLELMTNRLKEQGRLDMYTMTPDIVNHFVRSGGTRLVNPKGNAALFHIFRTYNYPIKRNEFAPNMHSMYERVSSREVRGKGAKEWLNNDYFSIFRNVFYSYPYKSDISLKVVAHILPKAGDQHSAGWEKLFDDQWTEVASLPDMLIRKTEDGAQAKESDQPDQALKKVAEKFHKNPYADYWPGGLYWAAFYLDELR